MKVEHLSDSVALYLGDCLDVLPTLSEASIDSCVTDPPYHLTSVVQRFGAEDAAPAKSNGTGVYTRSSRGFMGQTWDGGDIAFRPEVWAAVLRVLKPGAHLIAFGGTRTYHRMVCAIEDAGFEIRDCIQWLYATGFPKSHDVSKGIDRAAGAEREVIGRTVYGDGHVQNSNESIGFGGCDPAADVRSITAPVTPSARQWEGWGTALKPACEMIVLARKPLSEGTVAANVMRWGTGAINIGACRVLTDESTKRSMGELRGGFGAPERRGNRPIIGVSGSDLGRWPANVIHDGSDEVVAAFPESDHARGNKTPTKRSASAGVWSANGAEWGIGLDSPVDPGDSGSAARFFYSANRSPIEQVVITWISESEPCQATLLVDTEQLLERAIVVSASGAANGWSTFLSGSNVTALFRKASTCTIRTATSSTTESKIWNWLMHSLTNASIADVSYETENGGSPVATADDGSRSLIITLAETVFLPGASHAASKTQLKISVNVASAEQVSGARFHYGSKADADDRLGARHPTIKPVDLMQYLVRLVTPPRGLVLDPFAGTGTTGEAAWREGMRAVLIEAEPDYQIDIRRRIQLADAGPTERAHVGLLASGKVQTIEGLPLFDHHYDAAKDFSGSLNEGYRAIKERMANGGPGWKPK